MTPKPYRSTPASPGIGTVGEWFSIEVLNGATPAVSWFHAYGDLLVPRPASFALVGIHPT